MLVRPTEPLPSLWLSEKSLTFKCKRAPQTTFEWRITYKRRNEFYKIFNKVWSFSFGRWCWYKRMTAANKVHVGSLKLIKWPGKTPLSSAAAAGCVLLGNQPFTINKQNRWMVQVLYAFSFL